MSQKIKVAVHYVEVANLRVRYLVAGEGEPLLLVHGLSASTHWWIRNVQAFAQHYRVYLVDLPGFGSLRFPRARFVLADAASWLLSWMDAIGLTSAHFVGHSMGGYICMQIAAHHPSKVVRLVLIAPAVRPRVRTIAGYFVPLLTGFRYTTPSFLPILLFDALRAGVSTLLRATQDLITLDVQEEIQTISAPTLLIWGKNDTLVPLSLGYLLQEEISDSRLLLLKKASHVCMYDRARTFNTSVLSFLQNSYASTSINEV